MQSERTVRTARRELLHNNQCQAAVHNLASRLAEPKDDQDQGSFLNNVQVMNAQPKDEYMEVMSNYDVGIFSCLVFG